VPTGLQPVFLISSPPLSTKMPLVRDKILPLVGTFIPGMTSAVSTALDQYGKSTAFADLNNTILNTVTEGARVFFFNEAIALVSDSCHGIECTVWMIW